jgi:hypothetical protein
MTKDITKEWKSERRNESLLLLQGLTVGLGRSVFRQKSRHNLKGVRHGLSKVVEDSHRPSVPRAATPIHKAVSGMVAWLA